MNPGTTTAIRPGGHFRQELDRRSKANLAACLQCRKCTSGCPLAARADVMPHELVRLVQLGWYDEAMACRMIWECTSCLTCATRCPQKVSVAALIDALRAESLSARKAAATAVPAFNRIFLRIVRGRGRMHEMRLMAAFKLSTRRFLQDVGKLPMMLRKRKLSLWGSKAPGAARRKRMFDLIARSGGKNL